MSKFFKDVVAEETNGKAETIVSKKELSNLSTAKLTDPNILTGGILIRGCCTQGCCKVGDEPKGVTEKEDSQQEQTSFNVPGLR